MRHSAIVVLHLLLVYKRESTKLSLENPLSYIDVFSLGKIQGICLKGHHITILSLRKWNSKL